MTEPLSLLYPPRRLGSKFCNSTAAPGCMEKSSLSRIKPPPKETVTGDIAEVSGIYYYYPAGLRCSSIKIETVKSFAAEACALNISPDSKNMLASFIRR